MLFNVFSEYKVIASITEIMDATIEMVLQQVKGENSLDNVYK